MTPQDSGSSTKPKELKLVVVGDGYIGKTCMLWSYVYKRFPKDYIPTVFETHEVRVPRNGETYSLSLFDTAGQEDWETLRIMAYPDTDVVLLCFCVVRSDSFENIKSKWIPELNKYLPNATIILVGTQVDLRVDHVVNHLTAPSSSTASSSLSGGSPPPNSTPRHITSKEGEELRSRIKAYKYMECSALTQHNIKEVFDSAIDAVCRTQRQPSCFVALLRRFVQSLRTRFSSSSRTPRHDDVDSASLTDLNGEKAFR